jgi:hypothetical protein
MILKYRLYQTILNFRQILKYQKNQLFRLIPKFHYFRLIQRFHYFHSIPSYH